MLTLALVRLVTSVGLLLLTLVLDFPFEDRLAIVLAVGALPWSALQVFTGDERAVPPSDPLSNWGAAASELFAHVPLQESQLHRLRGEALLVHWTGATDYPLSGDAAAECFLRAAAPFARVTRQERAECYRLDLLRAAGGPG